MKGTTREYLVVLLVCSLLLSVFSVPAAASCDPPCDDCYTCNDDCDCVWEGCDPPCGHCRFCNNNCDCEWRGNCRYDHHCADCYDCVSCNCAYQCNPSTQFCCDGTCCNNGKTCCEGACCDPDNCETCVGGSCEVCGGDPDKFCCEGTCCDNGETCCEGECCACCGSSCCGGEEYVAILCSCSTGGGDGWNECSVRKVYHNCQPGGCNCTDSNRQAWGAGTSYSEREVDPGRTCNGVPYCEVTNVKGKYPIGPSTCFVTYYGCD